MVAHVDGIANTFLERVHDLFMGVRARLRAVCASQPIPNRIPHTFIRDHEHVLSDVTGPVCPPQYAWTSWISPKFFGFNSFLRLICVNLKVFSY